MLINSSYSIRPLGYENFINLQYQTTRLIYFAGYYESDFPHMPLEVWRVLI